MLGTLAIVYLFLGGAGAGTIMVCAFLDLIVVKQPFGTVACTPDPPTNPLARLVNYGFFIGLAVLVLGVLCLMFDLGRIDRVLSLFTSPTASIMSFGSYALVVLIVLGAALALVRGLYLPSIKRRAVVVVEVIAIPVAFAVMVYTGLLLQSMEGVKFWATPLTPMLFFLSSASSGIALLFVASLFVERSEPVMWVLGKLTRADAIVVMLEFACAIIFICLSCASENSSVQESIWILTQGDMGLVWGLGFGVCGMVIPVIVEITGMTRHVNVQTFFATVGVFVLVGAFCLRFSVAESGTHREIALDSPIGIELDVSTQDPTVSTLEPAADRL